MIAKFCSTASTSRDREVGSRILSLFDKQDLEDFFLEFEIPLVCKYCQHALVFMRHISVCFPALLPALFIVFRLYFQSLLENCVVRGGWLSLNIGSSLDCSVSTVEQRTEPKETIHPLFEVEYNYVEKVF
jgi:hypothetical protein